MAYGIAVNKQTNRPRGQTSQSIRGRTKHSSKAEIKRAYRTLFRLIHPDKLPNFPQAMQAIQKLQQAYERVKNGRADMSDDDEQESTNGDNTNDYNDRVLEFSDCIKLLLDVFLVVTDDSEERLSKEQLLERFSNVKYTNEAGDECSFFEIFVKSSSLRLCSYDQCFEYFCETHYKVGGQYVRRCIDPVTYKTLWIVREPPAVTACGAS